MNDTGVINTFLNTFYTYIDSGFGLLGGEVAFLSTTLIVIDITLAGLFWAWGADEDVMHRLVKKVMYVGFFAFVIGNFSALAGIVFESFAGLGLKASGSAISLADFMKPGSVAAAGFNARVSSSPAFARHFNTLYRAARPRAPGPVTPAPAACAAPGAGCSPAAVRPGRCQWHTTRGGRTSTAECSR